MKKIILAAAVAALGTMSMTAQKTIEEPSFGDNISIGIEGGVTTPIYHSAFFTSMRPVIGVTVAKQFTPVLGLGVEATTAINTSNWRGRIHSSTAFDQSYVGIYGTADLFNLFGGYNGKVRPFTIATNIGAGWAHDYFNSAVDAIDHYNTFEVKGGLDFNFNPSQHFTIALKPYVAWRPVGNYPHANVALNRKYATFNFLTSFSYRFGDYFTPVKAYDQAEVDGLNAQVNALRAAVEASTAENAALATQVAGLAADLAACQSQPVQEKVVTVKENQLNSVRFVFFRIGSYKITADQMPNVEMIADYMTHHPNSKVVIKGYASKDGNYEFNVKLAKERAESVAKVLTSKYKIPSNRIKAEGEGIGEMFEEESWNRVSICTLEEAE